MFNNTFKLGEKKSTNMLMMQLEPTYRLLPTSKLPLELGIFQYHN